MLPKWESTKGSLQNQRAQSARRGLSFQVITGRKADSSSFASLACRNDKGVGCGREGSGPQGLKPASWVAIGGTAEAVPFPVGSRDRVSEEGQSQRAGAPAPHSSCGSWRPSGTRCLSSLAHPGLPSWAIIWRPSGAGSLLRYQHKSKRPHSFLNVAFINAGNDLVSHTLSRAVQSARRGLT
jgi:hypothetical protein